MSPIVNPDTSEATELGAIPAGTYPAIIVSCEFTTSKAAGNPMIVPTFEVLAEGKKRKRSDYCVISGEGSGKFDQLLRCTGFEDIANKLRDKTIPKSEKPQFDTDNLINQELMVVIEPDTYKGELKDKIRSYLKRDGSKPASAPRQD